MYIELHCTLNSDSKEHKDINIFPGHLLPYGIFSFLPLLNKWWNNGGRSIFLVKCPQIRVSQWPLEASENQSTCRQRKD